MVKEGYPPSEPRSLVTLSEPPDFGRKPVAFRAPAGRASFVRGLLSRLRRKDDYNAMLSLSLSNVNHSVPCHQICIRCFMEISSFGGVEVCHVTVSARAAFRECQAAIEFTAPQLRAAEYRRTSAASASSIVRQTPSRCRRKSSRSPASPSVSMLATYVFQRVS